MSVCVFAFACVCLCVRGFVDWVGASLAPLPRRRKKLVS